MDKIKCIRSENGTIIPIHNIAVISAEEQFTEFDNMSYTDEPIKVEIKLEKYDNTL